MTQLRAILMLAGMAAVASAQAVNLDNGLFANWRMDEGSGSTVADASGHGNTGQVVNATWTSDVQQGVGSTQALQFSGLGTANVATATRMAPAQIGTFSYSFWCRPDGATLLQPASDSGDTDVAEAWVVFAESGYSALGGRGSACAGIAVGTNGVGVYAYGAPSAGGSYHPALLTWETSISGWIHLVITFNQGNPILFVNGSMMQDGYASTMPLYPSQVLGGDPAGAWGQFKGAIDNVRFYDRELTGAEISALAAVAPPTVTPPPPTATIPVNAGAASGGSNCGGTAAGSWSWGALIVPIALARKR